METPKPPTIAKVGMELRRIAAYGGIRVLAWHGDVLYAGRRYEMVRWRAGAFEWEPVARFHAPWWRTVTSRYPLTYRLMRDGFHALTILDDGTLVAAVPGAIVTCPAGHDEFAISHRVQRGTRPLHITSAPLGKIYWGEYFDNRERTDVHIYGSDDHGSVWNVAYTFPARSIRHVHNIVYDRWGDCLWILTGDEGAECRVLRASCDLRSVETLVSGDQQARAVAAIPTKDAVYLSTDTPLERNYVYRLDRSGRLDRLAELSSSSIYGCQVGGSLFFSTMVEPSSVNTCRHAELVGAAEGGEWQTLLRWKKDFFSMRYFQYGNVILPDGENTTRVLAATTIAVEKDDLTTSLWEVA